MLSQGVFWCALVVGAATGAAAFGESGEPWFEATVRVRLGRDMGQPVGSLLEARDEAGRVVFGAGVGDTHSTYVRDNCRLLTFYYKGPSDEVEIASLGKLYDDQHNGVRLVVDRDDLLAFFRYANPVRILRLADGGAWTPHTAAWAAGATRFSGLQYVGNRRLVFQAGGITCDDRPVYAPEQSGMYYYVNGRVFVFHDDPQRLLVYDWHADAATPLDPAAATEWPIEGYPFVFGVYRDEVLVATNIGNVYTYREGVLVRIRQSDGKSWQAYSMLNVYGDLLIGQYPSGSLFVYNEEGLRPFAPPVPVPENALPNAREAQTLAVYGGRLYAGVWPWGELWRYDPDDVSWEFVARVFEDPAVSREVDAPFAKEMQGRTDVYNYWGQRITSLACYQDALYIATMNKGGARYRPDEHAFLDPATVAQYGRVFCLKGNAQVAAPFTWREETAFRFVYDDARMAVFQDGTLLAEAPHASRGLEGRSVAGCRFGHGVYGGFAGEILASSSKARGKEPIE